MIKSLSAFKFLPYFIAHLELRKVIQPLEEHIKQIISDETGHFFDWDYVKLQSEAADH